MNQSRINDDTFDENYEMGFNILKAEIKKQCPESDILIRYSEKEISGKERKVLVEHLDMCPSCSEVVLNLKRSENELAEKTALPANWKAIEHEMDERIYNHLDSIKGNKAVIEAKSESIYTKILISVEQWFNRIFRPLNFAYAGLLISLCLGGTYTYAFLKRPAYFSIALVQPQKTGTLRGKRIESESLRNGLENFEKGYYDQAIESLKKYLKSQPDHYLANFYLGLTYLLNAKETLLGVAYRYDSFQIEQGITYLNAALIYAGDNAFYQEDCLWYLGKAYLMLGRLEHAKIHFERLVAIKQPNLMRKAAAKNMILKINMYISQ